MTLCNRKMDFLVSMSSITEIETFGLTTQDDFLNGRVRATQLKQGFRAGIDTVLLAASVSKTSINILELGAGTGVASCCVLADLPQAQATLVDCEPSVLALAQKNLIDNGFEQRAQTLMLDVTSKGNIRQAAGLQVNRYTSVIANPPFFTREAGTVSNDISKAQSRHMPKGDLELWVQTAAASATAQGEIIFVHVMEQLPDLLAAFHQRFGGITILPIISRPGEGAKRVLIRGIKGSRARLSMLSPLILHAESGGEYLPRAEAIFRGTARLDW